MKWHLMLKGVVCVANRVNGSKDGLSPVEWDDIQRYGVIRELRVEVFEPVGGGDDRRRRGFGGWHPRAHPDLAFNASFAAVVQTPSTCPRFGPRRQGRRSAELRFSLLRVCDPPMPTQLLALPCLASPSFFLLAVSQAAALHRMHRSLQVCGAVPAIVRR